MFLGYEIDGVLQKKPPDWLRKKMADAIAETLHVTFVEQVSEDEKAG
jgi:hypothetical protein